MARNSILVFIYARDDLHRCVSNPLSLRNTKKAPLLGCFVWRSWDMAMRNFIIAHYARYRLWQYANPAMYIAVQVILFLSATQKSTPIGVLRVAELGYGYAQSVFCALRQIPPKAVCEPCDIHRCVSNPLSLRNTKKAPLLGCFVWRRERDSNP